MDGDPYRDTGKTCLGRGMHCPSACSYFTVFDFTPVVVFGVRFDCTMCGVCTVLARCRTIVAF